MDINNQNQSSNTMPARTNAGGNFSYDLKSEKEEIAEITREVKTELLAKWKKSYANAQIFPEPIAQMHPEVVDFLLSFSLVAVYDNIAKQANLDGKGRNVLPRIIWQIAQTKKWDDLDQILETNLPLVHSVHVTVADLLNQNILSKIKLLSEKPIVRKIVGDEIAQKKQIQVSLPEALTKYPKLGEQSITSNQIKLRSFPTLVRPSIKNWIVDFHDVMGSGKHSPIDRGNFLFHSENGKRLTPNERQKIAIILKSLEDQTLLTIDVDSQIVIFENASERETQPSIRENVANNFNVPASPVASTINLDSRFRGNDNVVVSNREVNKNQQIQNNISSSFSKPIEEKKAETFFEIPGSKPPIGSDSFNVENVQNTNIAQTSLPAGHFSSSEEKKTLNKSLELQETQKNFSPNFATSEGNISFSSAQKLPVEQATAPQVSKQEFQPLKTQPTQQVQPGQIQNVPKPQQDPQPQRQSKSISPYRITPSGYVEQRNDDLPKIQGNTVDLRS